VLLHVFSWPLVRFAVYSTPLAEVVPNKLNMAPTWILRVAFSGSRKSFMETMQLSAETVLLLPVIELHPYGSSDPFRFTTKKLRGKYRKLKKD
jgi:hypothetical protein